MSALWLAFPECKYKNDADELLKDQFIFGIENKEIHDHLLGEMSETDNIVKALYDARKVESELAQRKMLSIVNLSSLVSVDAIKIDPKMKFVIVIFVVIPMVRIDVQLIAKYAIDVVRRTTLKRDVDKSQTQAGLVDVRVRAPDLIRRNVPIDARYMK